MKKAWDKKKKQSKAKKSTTTEVEYKVKDGALLSIEAKINLIPYVGGFLATYFSEIRSKRVEERMQKYFEYFSNRLIEIEESKIDHEYINSQEFAELFMRGAEQAARSTTEEKIQRFANILANNTAMDAQLRDRTESIMSFVDRITDLDAFVLIAYGDPDERSMRANTRKDIILFVSKLALYLGMKVPRGKDIVESVIYLDNLGLAWVNEKMVDEGLEHGEDLIQKEFSSFRTPLGNYVVNVITPPDFFISADGKRNNDLWPENVVNQRYKDMTH